MLSFSLGLRPTTLLLALACIFGRTSAQSSTDQLFKASDAGQRKFDQSVGPSGSLGSDGPVYDASAVDTLPRYPGGDAELFKQLRPIDRCKVLAGFDECLSTRVVVTFIVEKDGVVTSPRLLREACPALQAAALCAVMNLGKWVPGRLGGKTVRVQMTVPIIYDPR